MLTDMQIAKLKPRKQRFEVSDGNGLSLRVMPSGAKSWVFRYLFDGHPRRLTIGVYPTIPLAEARQLCSAAKMKVERDLDPGVEKVAAKASRKTTPTFSEFLPEFWEEELSVKKSGTETRRLLEKDIIPVWGWRKVSDIKRRDIVLLLDKIKKRAPVTRNRVHGALTRLFNFAAERGIIEESPCNKIRKVTETAKDRVLTDDEIRLLWSALDLDNQDLDIYRTSKLALKMILLTGQRPGEVCGMTWEEIDLENASWAIPAARMKNSEAHSIPLTRAALEVIEQARPLSNGSAYVFQSSYLEDRPITPHSLSRAVARHHKEMGFENRFTPHDLRRTLRTRLAMLGVAEIVAERVLGHKLQGILAVYNKHDYDMEKRQALETWERSLRRILGLEEPGTAQIIELRGRHG
ncbi:MAG: tyrosine-type recombinase/integrase [Thermodesulfobacteriota bacterium]